MIERRLNLERELIAAARSASWRHQERKQAYVEAFGRQTVYMETTAQIINQLGPEYRHLSDLWYTQNGIWQQIEHIVIGPKGIFFIDSIEADREPGWLKAWQQRKAYLSQRLGAYKSHFYAIIIDRGAVPLDTPPGTLVVSSPYDVLTAIQEGFSDEQLDPLAVNEAASLIERSFEALPTGQALLKDASRPTTQLAGGIRQRGHHIFTALQFGIWLVASIGVARDNRVAYEAFDLIVVLIVTGIAYLLGVWLWRIRAYTLLTILCWGSFAMLLIVLFALTGL